MTQPQPLDLDQIEARANAATEGPWDVHAHAHGASGCRCLSCDDPIVGFTVDHPKAFDCDEIVAARSAEGQLNPFRRPLASCDHGPLLSYEDADFAAHARADVPAMAAEIRQLRARVAELETRYLPKLCECGHTRFVHTVPAPNSCFAGQIRGAEPCDCAGYRQLSFAEAERRIAARHAAQAEQRAAAVETHVVADDSNDPEHTDDCPGCAAVSAARP